MLCGAPEAASTGARRQRSRRTFRRVADKPQAWLPGVTPVLRDSLSGGAPSCAERTLHRGRGTQAQIVQLRPMRSRLVSPGNRRRKRGSAGAASVVAPLRARGMRLRRPERTDDGGALSRGGPRAISHGRRDGGVRRTKVRPRIANPEVRAGHPIVSNGVCPRTDVGSTVANRARASDGGFRSAAVNRADVPRCASPLLPR